jgi:cell division control protein 7
MARAKVPRVIQDRFAIHEDDTASYRHDSKQYALATRQGDQIMDSDCDDVDVVMDESRDPLEESGRTKDSSDEDEDIDEGVQEDMARFEETFRGINKRYRLVNRIGEGTFSTVYKAEDLEYDRYQNDWDFEEKENTKWMSPRGRRKAQNRRRAKYVAIKKIYVTSSPMRILNELELLNDLRDSEAVCPLITAFRHEDQVIAILPYFQHQDFRDYFRTMKVPEMRPYFRSLFTALKAVHKQGILHRDIKPTNFLYHPQYERGVLVDFGLAEREGTDYHECVCVLGAREREERIKNSVNYPRIAAGARVLNKNYPLPSYPKSDNRSSRRANRAGTRGFRAPEVLYKCTAQTTAIDIWSVGVILLTLLSRRFPFFHSADDIDALLELTAMFGREKMRSTALLHGQIFESNIHTHSERGHSLEKIVLWALGRDQKDKEKKNYLNPLDEDEKQAVGFLEQLLEFNPAKRMTAKQALEHPFLRHGADEDDDADTVDLVSG